MANNEANTIIGLVFGAFLGVVGLSAVLGSFYTVDDGTVGVLSTFGKFEDAVATPGLHWKTPFIQDVTNKDVKLQTVNYKYRVVEDEDPNDGVTMMPSINILDSKNLPIDLELTLQYTPNADEMAYILRTFGHNYFDKRINPMVRDIVRDVAGNYEAEEIAKKRTEIGTSISVALEKEFAELPFTLNNVALRDIKLPPSVAEKVRQVQEAKQEEQRLAMVEKQELVNKKIAVIAAQKEAEVRVTTAEGEARSILTVAEAQAKANYKVASSLTPLLVKQNQIEKWDGVVAKYQLGSSTGVLMSMEPEKN